MFLDFFFTLRQLKVPVSITEWLTLIEALVKGCAMSSLTKFYFVARAILIKSEAFYDQYDQAFCNIFKKAVLPIDIRQDILDWLDNPLNYLGLRNEELEKIKQLNLDELKAELEKRLSEQTSRHDGGSHWVGTGGTSPFGHSGFHPGGIRIGGLGREGQAIQIASARRFKNYRTDITLDIRQIMIALKKIREFAREGPENELDIIKTIDKTCHEGGEIELVFSRERKNTVKVLLLMDSGGSMNPYSRLVSGLFSAAHQIAHFRDFKSYYFHNCIYQNLYKDIYNNEFELTATFLNTVSESYKVILVGDAYMAPSELFRIGGAIDYYYNNETPGIEWLKRIANHFRYCVWLNPLPERIWIHPTIKAVSTIFPMFPLTIGGLESAIKKLIVKK